MEEVAGAGGGAGLAVLAPADEGFAFEDVDNGVLLAVVVDAGFGAGLDEEGSAPEAGLDLVFGGDGGETQGAWGLQGS